MPTGTCETEVSGLVLHLCVKEYTDKFVDFVELSQWKSNNVSVEYYYSEGEKEAWEEPGFSPEFQIESIVAKDTIVFLSADGACNCAPAQAGEDIMWMFSRIDLEMLEERLMK